ncbi:MAG: hypothetical protein ACOYK6_06115 [Chthoniobacterales bacterium]
MIQKILVFILLVVAMRPNAFCQTQDKNHDQQPVYSNIAASSQNHGNLQESISPREVSLDDLVNTPMKAIKTRGILPAGCGGLSEDDQSDYYLSARKVPALSLVLSPGEDLIIYISDAAYHELHNLGFKEYPYWLTFLKDCNIDVLNEIQPIENVRNIWFYRPSPFPAEHSHGKDPPWNKTGSSDSITFDGSYDDYDEHHVSYCFKNNHPGETMLLFQYSTSSKVYPTKNEQRVYVKTL